MLRFASDLHLEFSKDIKYIDTLLPHMDTDKDTTLALLGDIHVGRQGIRYLKDLGKRFKAVIYILGNHEFYNYKFYDLKHIISDELIGTNVYVLENESVTIDGQKFVGCTLWSDMEKENPKSILDINNGLNDYRLIEGFNDTTIKPTETIQAHKDSIEYLKNSVDKRTIVLTHHSPLLGTSDPQFTNSIIRGGFESDLMDLIFDLQPKYWLYGHTHYNKGITEIGNTILQSNQYGYPFELAGGIVYNPTLVIDF